VLKFIIAATGFLRRCSLARVDLAKDLTTQKAVGKHFNELQIFIPSRLVGQSLNLRAFIDKRPVLRRVPLFFTPNALPLLH